MSCGNETAHVLGVVAGTQRPCGSVIREEVDITEFARAFASDRSEGVAERRESARAGFVSDEIAPAVWAVGEFVRGEASHRDDRFEVEFLAELQLPLNSLRRRSAKAAEHKREIRIGNVFVMFLHVLIGRRVSPEADGDPVLNK